MQATVTVFETQPEQSTISNVDKPTLLHASTAAAPTAKPTPTPLHAAVALDAAPTSPLSASTMPLSTLATLAR